MDGSVELKLDELGIAIVETVRAPLLVLDDLESAVQALKCHWFESVEFPREEAGS